jgi:predicted phage terminase large subunit-like protein
LVDRLKEHLGLPGTITALIAFAKKYPKALLKLIEDKANGPAVIQMLRSRMPGMVPVEPMGSKAARLAAVTPMIEAGNIYLPLKSTTPWVGDYIAELIAFPKGAHDDQVDMTSQALLRYHQRGIGISNAEILTTAEDDVDEASIATIPLQF